MTTTLAPPAEQSFVLDGADWQTYESLLRLFAGRHIFITCNKGRLELMAPSWTHGRQSRLLGLLVHHLAEHFSTPIIGGGSTTFRREDLERGLEPDQCFYVKNAAAVQQVEEIDLQRDPPPDLAIEVEISQRLSNRIDIYRAIGVPELWRYDGRKLSVCLLDAGAYVDRERGIAFPLVETQQLQRLLKMAAGKDEMTWAREVRKWLAVHHPVNG